MPKLKLPLPYLQPSRQLYLVMALLVSSDLLLSIQARWSTGWYISFLHTSSASNSMNVSESTNRFHFPRYPKSPHWYMATVHVWAPGLHFNTATNRKRVRLYWIAFAAMFTYEVIPAYIFPLLNGINIFCLASQHASPNVQNVFTNIFGGANSNEGLGLFSLGFDWQYIGSGLMPSANDIHLDTR